MQKPPPSPLPSPPSSSAASRVGSPPPPPLSDAGADAGDVLPSTELGRAAGDMVSPNPPPSAAPLPTPIGGAQAPVTTPLAPPSDVSRLGQLSTPAGYVPFRSGPVPSVAELPENIQIETLRLYITQLENEMYNLGVAHEQALESATAEATRERALREVALKAQAEMKDKVQNADDELTSIKLEIGNVNRALRRATDERDTLASRVAAANTAAADATKLARRACEDDLNKLADHVRTLREKLSEQDAQLEEATRHEKALVSRAEAAEFRASNQHVIDLTARLETALRDAAEARTKMTRAVGDLATQSEKRRMAENRCDD